jgi:glycosyltransferase involved in cell wall biosynthesis
METRLTVLMAVHNGAHYLNTAIDSILRQTYQDFRFLIVDDASTDTTREIVRSYQDHRIDFLCLERNLGQTGALNVGLKKISTPWIARMDADDFSAPSRLQEQMDLLDSDPSLRCVGTDAWTFNDDPEVIEGAITKPSDNAGIQQELLRGSPIIHGSIIVSRQALIDVGSYNERYRFANDVELYDRLLSGHHSANIPRKLLGIRRHQEQGSRTKKSFDEVIEIFENRLLHQDYSSQENKVVRATLSRFHVVRARFSLIEMDFLEAGRDLVRALQTSPKQFLWNCVFVSVVYQMSERSRVRVKKLLRKIPKPS